MNVMLQAPAAGMDSSMMWIMLILMFVIMYFFMIRPQNKKQKEIAEFRSYLKLGITHPLPEKLIRDFCGQVEKVIVIEEGEPYLEEAVKQLSIEAKD